MFYNLIYLATTALVCSGVLATFLLTSLAIIVLLHGVLCGMSVCVVIHHIAFGRLRVNRPRAFWLCPFSPAKAPLVENSRNTYARPKPSLMWSLREWGTCEYFMKHSWCNSVCLWHDDWIIPWTLTLVAYYVLVSPIPSNDTLPNPQARANISKTMEGVGARQMANSDCYHSWTMHAMVWQNNDSSLLYRRGCSFL